MHDPHIPETLIPLTTLAIQTLSPDIKSFSFAVDDPRWSFKAGQWIDLFVKIAGKWQVGGYSMTTSPTEKHRFDLVVRAAEYHPVTRYLHEQLQVGEQLSCSQGQGDFYYDEQDSDSLLLLATGIGVTPLLSMVRFAQAAGIDLPITLLHGSSQVSDFIYSEELAEYAANNPLFTYRPILAQPQAQWRGEVSLIDQTLLSGEAISAQTDVYFCGARGFIESTITALRVLSVKESRMHYEKWW